MRLPLSAVLKARLTPAREFTASLVLLGAAYLPGPACAQWTGGPTGPVYYNGGNGAILIFDTTNSVFNIQSIHQGVAVLPIALNPSGGNVGIGTTSPSAILHTKTTN